MITAEGWGWRHAGRKAWAVRDLDLRIEDGERVLLLGASGAGKSTLLHALAGVLGDQDEGEEAGRLLVDGRHPTRAIGHTALVQQNPESQVILDRVGDDVAFGCENLRVPPEQIWPRVHHCLELVGLDVDLRRHTTALSGGQKQRLALAGALAMGARTLLLDEPTANLDPTGVAEVRDAVASVVADRGTTLVVVEHRTEVWLDLVDRVIVLAAGGGVLADGPARAVLADQRETLLAAGVWVPDAPLGVIPLPRSGAADPVATRPVPSEPASGPSPTLAASGSPSTSTPASGSLLHTSGLLIGRDPARGPLVPALELDVPTARSTVITGPNGVGKSTLALTLAGLLPALGGGVVADPSLDPPTDRKGRVVADPGRWRSVDLLTRIGTVFQQPEHQFVTGSVAEEVGVGLRALGRDQTSIDATVVRLLERLRLSHLARANPFTLSGGEQRRLSVLTVLATAPRLLVLDEPTFGQDRSTWVALAELVGELVTEGHAIVSVTHDQAWVRALGQRHLELTAEGPVVR